MVRFVPESKTKLDAVDLALINVLQNDFPIARRPFATAAAKIGVTEQDLIARVRRLREAGVLTRFGPFFDAVALGGAFCLCAMAVPPKRFEEVATKVNEHAEVAHNYERAHRFNMWFILATETPDEIEAVAHTIEQETGLEVFLYPKLEEFFVGFKVAV